MNNRNKLLVVLVGFIVGMLYYYNMSSSISKEANCSFVANVWTDIGVFIAGAYVLYAGWALHDNVLLIIVGTAIITEHIGQLFHNKTGLFNR